MRFPCIVSCAEAGALKEIYVTEEFKEIEGELQAASGSDLPGMREGQIADISLEARAWIQPDSRAHSIAVITSPSTTAISQINSMPSHTER